MTHQFDDSSSRTARDCLFPGQISEKLWNDQDGSLREDTSRTLGV